jgi:hypothetical protein
MIDVNELRHRVKEQRTFADSVEAFFRLLEQPDLTWLDLLDGLNHPGLIAENAVIRLHHNLDVPVPQSGFISDRSVWAGILKERGIPENQRMTAK